MIQSDKIKEAIRYVEDCGWWLTIVKGTGDKPKAPIFDGWPDLRPSVEVIETYLDQNWDAGIGINLGGSRVFDVEADSDEGEQFLDDQCRGHDFPCWQSRRGKHRLFLVGDGDDYRKDDATKVEFRTGRHHSVLPPSIINGTEYRWINDPFSTPIPPLPIGLRQFYEEHRKGIGKRATEAHISGYEFRDDFDYILRNVDLLAEAVKLGLAVVIQSPDENGNVPCFVPEKLRGRPDTNASGVFNVRSGVLRDFADGKNYPFFRVIAALTGKKWDEVFDHYKRTAGAIHGRPHSRRNNPPTVWTGDREPLEEARVELNRYFETQLGREPNPKTLHIIKGPPGLGKTFGICQTLAEKKKRAVILTLENELADHHSSLLPFAKRMPVLRNDGCIQPKEYEATSRRGFQPSQGFPCQKCPIGTAKCPYLLKFGALESADQICCAAVYHTHDDFYSSHGNNTRPIVVFDENCIDLLLEPVSTTIGDWRSWYMMVSQCGHDIQKFGDFIKWLTRIESEFLLKEDAPKFLPVEIPDDLRGSIDETTIRTWLNSHADKFPHVTNLYREAVYLFTEPNSHILLERIEGTNVPSVRIRFRMCHPLPVNKEVFILDATANEDLLRAIAPDWNVEIWECKPIEQQGRIYQVMDYDLSRNKIRREVAQHAEDNPTWLPQVIDHILENHGPAALVSFKEVIDEKTDLLSLLKHRDKITRTDNFPCRGHSFDEKTLIIVGTPYKDEACIWEFAMALWGKYKLPKSGYVRHDEINGDFISSNRRHDEPHLQPIQDFVLTADLVQAIGRVRPLQNDVKVFVLSNAPIHGWRVEQRMASEMFQIQWHKRKDAAGNQSRYFQAARNLLRTGQAFGNAEVCAIIQMPERTGRQYWKPFKESLKTPFDENRGRIRLKVPVALIF